MVNVTLGLGILNNTLRIAMDCGAMNLWLEPDPSGVGVAWHGPPAWDFATMRSRLGLDYKVLTELPAPEKNLYPDMLALMKGVADVSIDYWGVNYERSQLVDFSYPQFYTGVSIISGKKKGFFSADLVMGVYDDTSFGLLILAIVAMIIMSWILLRKESREHSLFECALYLFENVLHQPLNGLIVPKAWLGRVIMTFFSIYNLALNLMYMSMIISLLTSGSQPPEINSLADLNKEEYQEIRIFMKKLSFVPQFLKSANMLEGFEHRVDYIDAPDLYNITHTQIIESILDGSHIFITSYGNFYSFLCRNNKDENKTVAKLQDFRQSRQDLDFQSIMSLEQQFTFQGPFVFNEGRDYYQKRLFTCWKD